MQRGTEENAPSLDLAFDWLKDVLEEQAVNADGLANRATLVFGLGTAVEGIGLPLVGVLAKQGGGLPPLAVATIILYGLAVAFAASALWVRGFETLRNPLIIRERYWDMEPTQFKREVLTHMEDCFKRNGGKLQLRGYAVQGLTIVVGAITLLLVLSLWRVL